MATAASGAKIERSGDGLFRVNVRRLHHGPGPIGSYGDNRQIKWPQTFADRFKARKITRIPGVVKTMVRADHSPGGPERAFVSVKLRLLQC